MQDIENRLEKAHEEQKRKVRHQIESNRRFEDQAQGLLRISLTGLWLLITAISVLYTTGYIQRVELPPLEQLVADIETELLSLLPIGGPQAELILSLAGSISFSLFFLSMMSLVYSVPKHSYRVLKPSDMAASVHEGVDKQLTREDYLEDLVDSYEVLIRQNQRGLDETREAWEKAYNSLRKGILYLVGSLVSVSLIILFRSGLLVIIIISAAAIWASLQLDRSSIEAGLELIAVWSPISDICLLTISLTTVYINNQYRLSDHFGQWAGVIDTIAIISVLTLVVYPLYSLTLTREKLSRIVAKYTVIWGILFLTTGLGITGTSESDREGEYYLIWDLVISLDIWLIFAILSIFAIILFKMGYWKWVNYLRKQLYSRVNKKYEERSVL